MNAYEKVAWLEISTTLLVLLLLIALYPFLGEKSLGAFGFLGVLGFSVLFLIPRQNKIIADERDRSIDLHARFLSSHFSWLFSFLGLLTLILWNEQTPDKSVSISILTWLLWIQFALMYLVKGIVTLILYRKSHYAS